MFEAVYITDSQNSLAYENLIFQHVPSFSAIVDTLNTRFSEHKDSPIQTAEVGEDYFVCSHAIDRLILYVLCSKQELDNRPNPLAPFVLIDKLIETMKEYFGSPLTATKVSANNDTLSLLIHQMIADGMPNITEFNNLKDVVSSKSILSKILHTGTQLAAAANNKSLASLANNGMPGSTIESSPVPWRRANARYTNNEMFVDVTETVNVILRPKKSKNGSRLSSTQNFDSAFYSTSSSQSGKRLSPITGTISGKIDFLSRITGVPELQILFNTVKSSLEIPQFHRCVDLDTWRQSKSLSFIPPDGSSTLMTYQIDIDSLSERKQLGMLGLLEFDLQDELGINKDEFELKITSSQHKAVPKIEAISIEIFAHTPPVYASKDPSFSTKYRELTNGIEKMRAIRVSDGDFTYKGSGRGYWDMKNLATGCQPTLRVAISTTMSESTQREQDHDEVDSSSELQKRPLPPLWLKVNFSYKGQVPSGLRIDSLKLISSKGMGDSVKPYKGVKYITEAGDFTIRGH